MLQLSPSASHERAERGPRLADVRSLAEAGIDVASFLADQEAFVAWCGRTRV